MVGVARAGDVLTDERTTVAGGDEVFLAGSDEAIRELDASGGTGA